MGERVPIKSAHALSEALADRVFRFETKQFAGGVIHIRDAAFRIGDDDSFLNRVEDGLDQPLLLREPEEVILDLLRPHAPKTLDQFIEKARFHSPAV